MKRVSKPFAPMTGLATCSLLFALGCTAGAQTCTLAAAPGVAIASVDPNTHRPTGWLRTFTNTVTNRGFANWYMLDVYRVTSTATQPFNAVYVETFGSIQEIGNPSTYSYYLGFGAGQLAPGSYAIDYFKLALSTWTVTTTSVPATANP